MGHPSCRRMAISPSGDTDLKYLENNNSFYWQFSVFTSLKKSQSHYFHTIRPSCSTSYLIIESLCNIIAQPMAECPHGSHTLSWSSVNQALCSDALCKTSWIITILITSLSSPISLFGPLFHPWTIMNIKNIPDNKPKSKNPIDLTFDLWGHSKWYLHGRFQNTRGLQKVHGKIKSKEKFCLVSDVFKIHAIFS